MSVPLIAFGQESAAQLLANYLRSEQVMAQVVEDESGTFTVFIADSQQLELAQRIANEFVRHPHHPKYQQTAWQQGEQVTLSRRHRRPASTWLNRAISVPFTSVILMLCAFVYALSFLGLFSPIAQWLMMQPLNVLAESHQWWRLIGPAFIHFSVLHIVFNLLWWGMLGAQIERALGISMLAIVFLLSAVTSNIAQALVTEQAVAGVLPFGGLSGVVYALLGFVWWLGWLKPHWGLSISKQVVGFMLVWLVLGYADVLWVNMANAAHTVGLITGCLLAALLSIGADKRNQG